MMILAHKRLRFMSVSLLVGLLLLFEPLKGIESQPPVIAISDKPSSAPSTLPFEVGEKLSYDVSWKIFDAGTATMVLVDRVWFQNEEMYKVNAVVRSTGIVSTLFKVVDVFESFFHTKELCSYRIMKDILEGRRHRNTVVTFDRRSLTARMEDKDLTQTRIGDQARRKFYSRLCAGCHLSALRRSDQKPQGRRVRFTSRSATEDALTTSS